ncbi:hypothetical protein GTQ99_00145 [Kineococcus sp. T13]|uniref:hypothetical protein n=1 Tax=Kineococcus vitellinus TaxID=2696565 RepID=UPI001412746E|nr:hypothetical protein [Kineococcus vitellinus]NAZ73840.1 hypothetical protein [Kineococcus vitellinus]
MISPDSLSPFTMSLVALGGWGFLIFAVLTGILVTKRQYDEMKAQRDEWRDVARMSEEARRTLEQSVNPLIEQVKTSNHLLNSIRDRAPRSR